MSIVAHMERAGAASTRVYDVRRRTKQDLAEMAWDDARDEVAEMLEHGIPDLLGSLRVRALLTWCPSLGPARVAKMMATANVRTDARLRHLSEDRRWRLADVLRGVAR